VGLCRLFRGGIEGYRWPAPSGRAGHITALEPARSPGSATVPRLRHLPLLALLTAGASALVLHRPAPAQPRRPAITSKEIAALLEPIRVKHKMPALAAAVVTSDGLIAGAAVGVRKHGSDTPATFADLFHLGSDTKAMTAWLIARLIEEGKLSWGLTLADAFPELARTMPEDLRRVTLTQLLAHRSGLPANLKSGWWGLEGTMREQREAAVKSALAEKPEAAPGKRFLYSNVGYVVAGTMAERAGKASWEGLMRQKVFGPLGMKSAGFGAPFGKGDLDQPWPHSNAGRPIRPGPEKGDNPAVMGPAGTVHCSLPDWSRFVADVLRGARGKGGKLNAASYEKLFTVPGKGNYAVGGWLVIEKGAFGERTLTHDGSNTMNYATALLLPGRDLAVLVATNQGGPGGPGQKGTHEARGVLLSRLGKKGAP
jgi:CubicO group peptidase (beta-lactamase class C family)